MQEKQFHLNIKSIKYRKDIQHRIRYYKINATFFTNVLSNVTQYILLVYDNKL